MLKKNLEKEKRRERRKPIGRPARFEKKTTYNRKKIKNERDNEYVQPDDKRKEQQTDNFSGNRF